MTVYLAWIRGGRGPEAQIWRDLPTAEPYYRASPPRGLMHDRFINKFEIKADEETLPVSELAKRYPCPTQR